MKRFFLLLPFFFLIPSLTAQRIDRPDATVLELAQTLKKQYEDVSVAATSRYKSLKFNVEEALQLVSVELESSENLLALQGDYDYLFAEFYNEMSEISNIEVRTGRGKRQRVEAHRNFYEQDGIFYSDAKVCYFPLAFPLQGNSYKIQYQKQYKDVRYFPSIYFGEGYPVQQSILEFSIPVNMKMDLVERNFEGFKIEKTLRQEGNYNIITYTATDLPPMQRESSMKGQSHIYPHLLIVPQSFSTSNETIDIFNNTQDLYNWYQSLVGKLKNDKSAMAALAKELTQNATTDEEKIRAIYYWVQDNIRYIAFEDGIAGFKPDECQNVLDKKYGDCKGMANLTKELLLAVGLDARLTWIGTKRLAYDYSTPCLAVDNHMICTVMQNGEPIYLDATEEFNAFGTYGERIQGRQVLIENGKEHLLKIVPVIDYKNNTRHLRQNLELKDDQLVGTGSYIFEGESKADFLYNLNSLGKSFEKDAIEYYVTDGNKSYQATAIERSNLNDRDAEMRIDFDLTWENAVAGFGNEIYLSLETNKSYSQASFEEDRMQDYLFPHKLHQRTTTTLNIPNGYSVTYLPEPLHIETERFLFDVRYEVEGQQLIYNKTIALPQAEIQKCDFETWNAAIKQLNAMYNEQVVLRSKS